MITVNNLSLSFGGTTLFSQVDLQFNAGNCYGVIGANGSGKSTFLKILAGELESSTGAVNIKSDARMSVLKQDQNMYDEFTVVETVIMGNHRLYECGQEKDVSRPTVRQVQRKGGKYRCRRDCCRVRKTSKYADGQNRPKGLEAYVPRK